MTAARRNPWALTDAQAQARAEQLDAIDYDRYVGVLKRRCLPGMTGPQMVGAMRAAGYTEADMRRYFFVWLKRGGRL
jgi:hypothetical protein